MNKEDTLVILQDLHFDGCNDVPKSILKQHIEHFNKHPNWKIGLNGDIFEAQHFNSHPKNVNDKLRVFGDELKQSNEILKPLFDKISFVNTGNHDENIYRKINMWSDPIFGDAFSLKSNIKDINSNAHFADLQRGSLIEWKDMRSKNNFNIYSIHGRMSSPAAFYNEFNVYHKLFENLHGINLGHLHNPLKNIITTVNPETHKARGCWITRGGCYTYWSPYLEKKGFGVPLLGYVKYQWNDKLEEPVPTVVVETTKGIYEY
jgi:hypothetical protein